MFSIFQLNSRSTQQKAEIANNQLTLFDL